MLEQQHRQLVRGLQEMYRRMIAAQIWRPLALSESTGGPLIHDILDALGLLEKKDDSRETTAPEHDCEKLQTFLSAGSAPISKRRDSLSSAFEQSRDARSSAHSTQDSFKAQKSGFEISMSPATVIPTPEQGGLYSCAVQQPLLQDAASINKTPPLYRPECAAAGHGLFEPASIYGANFMVEQRASQGIPFDLHGFRQEAMMGCPFTSQRDWTDDPDHQLIWDEFGSMQNFECGYYA